MNCFQLKLVSTVDVSHLHELVFDHSVALHGFAQAPKMVGKQLGKKFPTPTRSSILVSIVQETPSSRILM